MKAYQKAEMIAKNLPTGSYAAGCPVNGTNRGGCRYELPDGSCVSDHASTCQACEVTR